MSAGERARPPTIDRFRFDALIGSGAFGDVYRAHDKLHGAPVAVKVLRRAAAQQLRRLKREFRSLADVAHPNLVRLYELLADGDECCLVMELIDGVDLAPGAARHHATGRRLWRCGHDRRHLCG